MRVPRRGQKPLRPTDEWAEASETVERKDGVSWPPVAQDPCSLHGRSSGCCSLPVPSKGVRPFDENPSMRSVRRDPCDEIRATGRRPNSLLGGVVLSRDLRFVPVGSACEREGNQKRQGDNLHVEESVLVPRRSVFAKRRHHCRWIAPSEGFGQCSKIYANCRICRHVSRGPQVVPADDVSPRPFRPYNGAASRGGGPISIATSVLFLYIKKYG